MYCCIASEDLITCFIWFSMFLTTVIFVPGGNVIRLGIVSIAGMGRIFGLPTMILPDNRYQAKTGYPTYCTMNLRQSQNLALAYTISAVFEEPDYPSSGKKIFDLVHSKSTIVSVGISPSHTHTHTHLVGKFAPSLQGCQYYFCTS